MPTKRDLNRTTQRLVSLGMNPLCLDLLSGKVTEERNLFFTSLKTAKAVQKLLYEFLWFYPSLGISLSLDKETSTLKIRPRGKTETRGRRGEGRRR